MVTDNRIQTSEPAVSPAPRSAQTRPQPTPATAPPDPHQKGIFGWLVIIAVCAVLVGAVIFYLRRTHAQNAAAVSASSKFPPVPIMAGYVKQKNVPVFLDGLGTVQAFNTVTVHVRVDGQLKKVAFTEGQDVHVGDLLAQIDPDPFQTALEQAIAKKAQDAALLANAQLDMKREVVLYAAKVDSQQVYDTQKALVDQYDAAVKADQAAIDSAQVQLNYTKILAPIEGRTGLRQVDQGNIVHATDTNGLVVLTQLKPISVMFTLPEQDLSEIRLHSGSPTNQFVAVAVDRDNKTILDTGVLAVIDNQIDTTTGTLRLKATFPNEKLNLWPGQFVNVRLRIATLTNALVVPAQAVQRGPDGAYIFMVTDHPATNHMAGAGKKGGKGEKQYAAASSPAPVNPEAKTHTRDSNPAAAGGTNGAPEKIYGVRMQKIEVAPQIEANESVVTSGLQKGDRIVVDGQYKLQEGSAIRIVSDHGTNAVGSAPQASIQ